MTGNKISRGFRVSSHSPVHFQESGQGAHDARTSWHSSGFLPRVSSASSCAVVAAPQPPHQELPQGESEILVWGRIIPYWPSFSYFLSWGPGCWTTQQATIPLESVPMRHWQPPFEQSGALLLNCKLLTLGFFSAETGQRENFLLSHPFLFLHNGRQGSFFLKAPEKSGLESPFTFLSSYVSKHLHEDT